MTAPPSLLIVGCWRSLAQSGSFLDPAEQLCEACWSSEDLVCAVLCWVMPGAACSISVPGPAVSHPFPWPCLVQATGALRRAPAAAEVSGAQATRSLRTAMSAQSRAWQGFLLRDC